MLRASPDKWACLKRTRWMLNVTRCRCIACGVWPEPREWKFPCIRESSPTPPLPPNGNSPHPHWHSHCSLSYGTLTGGELCRHRGNRIDGRWLHPLSKEKLKCTGCWWSDPGSPWHFPIWEPLRGIGAPVFDLLGPCWAASHSEMFSTRQIEHITCVRLWWGSEWKCMWDVITIGPYIGNAV